MFACIPSSWTCCYLWLQIGWDYTFVNEAHVFLFKGIANTFFSSLPCWRWAVWGDLGLDGLWSSTTSVLMPTLFLLPQTLTPLHGTSPSPCPRAQKKVHCAGREWVQRGLVLVSTMCCSWNTHLPPGFASGAGFLFRLSWAGAGLGPALWLARAEPLWTPGWLELPNSNPSITGIQIQTRAKCQKEYLISAKSQVKCEQHLAVEL